VGVEAEVAGKSLGRSLIQAREGGLQIRLLFGLVLARMSGVFPA
jgi:hypothetical protein